MKLNNEGWGLSTFLMFSIIFIIAIAISAVNAYKLGITEQKGEIQFSNTPFNYSNVESNLKDVAKRYIETKDLKVTDTLYLTIDELVKYNYMQTPVNNNYINCSGYVKVSKKSNENFYEPYIKCGSDYQTHGYEVEFDKK